MNSFLKTPSSKTENSSKIERSLSCHVSLFFRQESDDHWTLDCSQTLAHLRQRRRTFCPARSPRPTTQFWMCRSRRRLVETGRWRLCPIRRIVCFVWPAFLRWNERNIFIENEQILNWMAWFKKVFQRICRDFFVCGFRWIKRLRIMLAFCTSAPDH